MKMFPLRDRSDKKGCTFLRMPVASHCGEQADTGNVRTVSAPQETWLNWRIPVWVKHFPCWIMEAVGFTVTKNTALKSRGGQTKLGASSSMRASYTITQDAGGKAVNPSQDSCTRTVKCDQLSEDARWQSPNSCHSGLSARSHCRSRWKIVPINISWVFTASNGHWQQNETS